MQKNGGSKAGKRAVMGLLTQIIVDAGQGEQEPEETRNKKKK
jgi:hypothetical protein